MTPSAVLAGGVRKRALTREQVIERILRWNALYGEPPRTADWNPSLARWRAQEWRIQRYRLGDPETGERWPSLNSVKRLFGGSFDAAVREAGLVPHRPGPRRRAAGAVRPAVEQRAPHAPRDVETELLAAAERVLEAERRALRAEERARRVAQRAEDAAGRVAEARERARAAERAAGERVRAAERAARDAATAAERRARAAERRVVEVERELAEAHARAAAHAALAADGNGNGAAQQRVTAAAGGGAEARMAAAEARAAVAEARARAAQSAAAARRADAARAGRDRDAALARAERAERRAREVEAAVTGGRALTATEIAALRAGGGPVGPGPLAAALRALAAARATGDRRRLAEALGDVASAAVRWRERL